MSNLVIVAIPDENDRVWKVSSEKVPHLTVLFLGDMDNVSNLDTIMQFVEHAANTSLRRFYLPVDRRGELGADKADVLFFKKGRYDYKAIRDFRAQLLMDNNIRTAYDSAQQFEGPWNPHLTLGYPTAPAKPDDTDRDFGFYDVSFNRIAVWTGDFEGPDFLLKDYWDEWDALESVPMDVAMSTLSMNEAREAERMAALEHFGVKGMHWGVRKAAAGGKAVARGAAATSRFVQDVNFESRVESGKAREMVVNAAHKPFQKEDLPAVKARHGDYGKLTNRVKKPLSKEAKAYRKDARETYVKRLESTANSMKNASGDRQYTIRERGVELPAEGGSLPKSKYYWDVSSRKVQHADNSIDVTTVELVFDNEGWITETKTVPATLEQTADLGAHFLAHFGLEMDEDVILEHYGVKGMRWGVRKAAAGGKALARGADNVLFELGTQNQHVVQGISNQAHKTMKKEDLPALKAKHGAAGKKVTRLKKPLSAESKAYRTDVKAAYLKRLEETANTRTNFQGNRRYTLKEKGEPNTKKYFWKLSTEKIQHADDEGDPFAFTVRPVFDDDGFIIDFEMVTEDEMAQSVVDLGATLVGSLLDDDSLEHFGVKGMRWGVRKERLVSTQTHTDTGIFKRRTKIRAEGGEGAPAHEDAVNAAVSKQLVKKSGTDALSTQELRDLANRMQVENQVSLLMTSKGKKFVTSELETEGKQQLKKGAKKAAPHVIKRAGKAAGAGALVALL